MLFNKNKPKIFCIGLNKTGTTSVEKALSDHGFKLGDQKNAQELIESYKVRDFKSISNFCKNADAFQDAPFSWHYTGIFMDQYFNNAKFILTERDNEEQWYDSLVNFHSKLLEIKEGVPTADDLKKAKRTNNRTMWDNFNARHEIYDNNPYEKGRLIKYYLDHNKMVRDYFRFRDNLLIINLSDKGSYQKFCKFLELKPLYDSFPWENKT